MIAFRVTSPVCVSLLRALGKTLLAWGRAGVLKITLLNDTQP